MAMTVPEVAVPPAAYSEDEPDEELEEIPEAEMLKDPFYGRRIKRNINGAEFSGKVWKLERGQVSKDLLYLVQYDDQDLEHLTADQLKECVVEAAAPAAAEADAAVAEDDEAVEEEEEEDEEMGLPTPSKKPAAATAKGSPRPSAAADKAKAKAQAAKEKAAKAKAAAKEKAAKAKAAAKEKAAAAKAKAVAAKLKAKAKGKVVKKDIKGKGKAAVMKKPAKR